MHTSDEIEREVYSAAADMRCQLQGVKAYYCIGDDKMHAQVLYNDKSISFIIDEKLSLTGIWHLVQKGLWRCFSPPFMEFDHQ